MIKHCYIHIPFCKEICTYCDFCKLYYNKKWVTTYLNALEQEITSTYQNDILDTIYIGGGTPSSLSLKELERLFEILKPLKKSPTCEITIEVNPDVTKEQLDLLKKSGVNRLSLGLESTHPWILKKMNRSLDKEKVKETIRYAKEIGVSNINVDLMYAFPNETLEEVREDIAFIKELEVSHISTYSLILEEHTKLYIDKEEPISEEKDYEMYQEIIKSLKDYNHYEISNFSKEGYESKHNLCYWQNKKYYGFGLGAAGYIGNIRYQNTRSITNYLQGKYHLEEEVLTKYDIIEYEIILNLRTKEGISKTNFKEKYDIELMDCYNYKKLVKENLLIEEEDKLYIPEQYWYTSNEILVNLLEECLL